VAGERGIRLERERELMLTILRLVNRLTEMLLSILEGDEPNEASPVRRSRWGLAEDRSERKSKVKDPVNHGSMRMSGGRTMHTLVDEDMVLRCEKLRES
jgi:hypothetical protein